MEKDKEYSFRVISNQVRFGCGYRLFEGRRQYFAWHGYPNRNDDYFTTAEISETEYQQIIIFLKGRYIMEGKQRNIIIGALVTYY
jgi:hypothetical protein